MLAGDHGREDSDDAADAHHALHADGRHGRRRGDHLPRLGPGGPPRPRCPGGHLRVPALTRGRTAQGPRHRPLDRFPARRRGWHGVPLPRLRRAHVRVQARPDGAGVVRQLSGVPLRRPGPCVVPLARRRVPTARVQRPRDYQFHVGVFSARDDAGQDTQPYRVATFLDALERVEYLADLGINAVQLLPVVEFHGALECRLQRHRHLLPGDGLLRRRGRGGALPAAGQQAAGEQRAHPPDRVPVVQPARPAQGLHRHLSPTRDRRRHRRRLQPRRRGPGPAEPGLLRPARIAGRGQQPLLLHCRMGWRASLRVRRVGRSRLPHGQRQDLPRGVPRGRAAVRRGAGHHVERWPGLLSGAHGVPPFQQTGGRPHRGVLGVPARGGGLAATRRPGVRRRVLRPVPRRCPRWSSDRRPVAPPPPSTSADSALRCSGRRTCPPPGRPTTTWRTTTSNSTNPERGTVNHASFGWPTRAMPVRGTPGAAHGWRWACCSRSRACLPSSWARSSSRTSCGRTVPGAATA
jgi:hypothetical protein